MDEQRRNPAVNGSVTVSGRSLGLPQNSNGENQIHRPDVNGTVLVTAGSVPLRQARGEDFRARNLNPIDQGTVSTERGHGLPLESFPASSQRRNKFESDLAPFISPSTHANGGGGGGPGAGLPANVMIK
jgi:hypothetical protein